MAHQIKDNAGTGSGQWGTLQDPQVQLIKWHATSSTMAGGRYLATQAGTATCVSQRRRSERMRHGINIIATHGPLISLSVGADGRAHSRHILIGAKATKDAQCLLQLLLRLGSLAA